MNQLFGLALLICITWSGHLRAQMRIDGLHGISTIPEVKRHGLKGQVRIITQRQSPIVRKNEDLLDGFSGQNYAEEYNRGGYLQKRTIHDDFNKPRSITQYEYDARNRVTATWEEELAPNPFGLRTDGRIDYDYVDARNAFIVHDNRTILGKDLHRRIETVRDTINRILTTREYQGATLLTQEQWYWWDVNGYVTKQISRIRNRPPTASLLQKEDFKRLLVALSKQEERALDSLMRAKDSLQTRQYKSNPEWRGDTTFYQNNYDTQGRLLWQESYRGTQRTGAITYSYKPDVTQVVFQSFDREGNLISENTSRRSPVDRHILTDSSRHKTEGKWETSAYNYENTKNPVYQYRYDSQGNWIEQKQVDATGKQIGTALIRTIEYY